MDEMAKFPGLRPRGQGGIYSFRKRVPNDLVDRIGRKDIWISLRTNDLAVAKLRYLEEALKLESLFADQRRRRDLLMDRPQNEASGQAEAVSASVALALSRKLVAEARRHPEFEKTRYDYDEEQADDIAAEIDSNLADLRAFNEEGQRRVYQATLKVLEGQQTGGSKGSSGPTLRNYVRRALTVIAEEERVRFRGDILPQANDADFQNIGADDLVVEFTPTASLKIKEASDLFWKHRIEPEISSPKTERKYRAAIGLVVSFLGAENSIRDVTRGQASDFRALVARMPSNFTKKVGKEQSLENMAALADENGWRRMSFETQGTYLNMMLRFLSWAHDEDHIPQIKLSGIKPLAKKTNAEDKRSAFTPDQLNAIFRAPIFTGSMDDEYRFARPGPYIIKRSRYWVPLVALYTGMRLGEILQLTTGHIRTSEEGTHFFLLTRDMQLKNIGSRREVPLHSDLVSFGFLDFVKGKRLAGDVDLFNDVPFASDGTRSTLYSKRFITFLKSVGIKDVSVDACFHMFRHTLRDALGAGQVPEEYVEAICGWSRSKKTSRQYGTGLSADTLSPWIEKLKLPKCELGHLRIVGGGASLSHG